MNFYENLKSICESKGLKLTPTVLKCGGTKGVISGWKRGAYPNSEIVMQLSVLLNVPSDMLLFGKENCPSNELTEDEQELLDLYKKLSEKNQGCVLERARTLQELELEQKKRITVTKLRRKYIDIANIAAGAGISVPFTEDDSFTQYSFPENDIPENADCGIPINGNSMEPEYPDGCIVWVNRTAPVKFGDTIIAIVNGEPYCKIYMQDGLYSFNTDYEPIKISDDTRFELFGKVIGFYTEN